MEQDAPTPTTETQTQSPQPSIEKMKVPEPKKALKKIILIFLIIIIIIIIAVGVGAYTLAKQLLPSNSDTSNITETQNAAKILNNPIVKKMIQTAPIPKVTMIPITITLNPTPTTNPSNQAQTNQPKVNNWKTYENTTYKFSINYPGNETYQENNHGLGVINVAFFDTTQGSSADSPDFQFLLFPKAIGSIIGQDFDQLYNLPSPSAQVLKINNSSQQFTKLQNTNINGLRAFIFQSTSYPPTANEEPEDGNYIELGDNILTISTAQSNQAILGDMINSFKYTP